MNQVGKITEEMEDAAVDFATELITKMPKAPAEEMGAPQILAMVAAVAFKAGACYGAKQMHEIMSEL